jgi:hypothetical protein
MSIHLKEEYRHLVAIMIICAAIFYFGSAGRSLRVRETDAAIARIRAAAVLTTGSIIEFRKGSGRRPRFIGHYTFGVMGILYNGEKTDGRMEGREFQLLHKSFPVVYERDHPGNNAILIYPSDFSEFGLPYPDSLRSISGGE